MDLALKESRSHIALDFTHRPREPCGLEHDASIRPRPAEKLLQITAYY
jgi:hypothetical protein